MFPARWDRKVPESEFWCEENPMSCVSVDPGPCCGGDQEIMLFVISETEMEVALERGEPLSRKLMSGSSLLPWTPRLHACAAGCRSSSRR